jgi:hypothetical protein
VGNPRPLPRGARWGLDSLLFALQATADPAVVNGRYELRVGTEVFTVDGTSGSVRVRRGTADRPEATLTTDADTLHAAALGSRAIADAVEAGELRLDGDPQAIGGLTGPATGADQHTIPAERKCRCREPDGLTHDHPRETSSFGMGPPASAWSRLG